MRRLIAFVVACGTPHFTGSEPEERLVVTPPPTRELTTYTITGPDDIDDTFLNVSDMAASWGGYGAVWYGGSYLWRPLVRVSTAGLPGDGQISEVRFRFHAGDFYNGGYQTTLHAYRLAVPWIEGVAGGEEAPGATWNSTGLSTWQAPGCSAAGYDYVPDSTPPTINPVEGWNTWKLPAAWAEAWRNGDNNGFIVVPAPEGGPGNFNQWLSSEAGDNAPSFEVDIVE